MPASKLRTDLVKNAGGVKLRLYADSLNIDFPINTGAQLQQFIWERLCAEAERLGVELRQEARDE